MQQVALPGMEIATTKSEARRRQRREKQIISATEEAIRGINLGLELLQRISREVPVAGIERPPARPEIPATRWPRVPEATAVDDVVAQFARECMVPEPGRSLNATMIYGVFRQWFVSRWPSAPTVPSQRAFGSRLRKKLPREKHGTYIYYHAKLREPELDGGLKRPILQEP